MESSVGTGMEGQMSTSVISCTTNDDCMKTPVNPVYMEPLLKNYPRPCMSLVGLMIMALWNTENKTLTCNGLKQIISCLFPYYKNRWKADRHRGFIRECTSGNFSSFFLKYRIAKQYVLIMLSPAEQNRWEDHLQSYIKGRESDIKSSMGQPDLLEILQHGHARLDTWVQHGDERSKTFQCLPGTLGTNYNADDEKSQSLAHGEREIRKAMCEIVKQNTQHIHMLYKSGGEKIISHEKSFESRKVHLHESSLNNLHNSASLQETKVCNGSLLKKQSQSQEHDVKSGKISSCPFESNISKDSAFQDPSNSAKNHRHVQCKKIAVCGPSPAAKKHIDSERGIEKRDGPTINIPVVSHFINQVLHSPLSQSEIQPCEIEQAVNVASTDKVQVNSNVAISVPSDSDLSDSEVEIIESFCTKQSSDDEGQVDLISEPVVTSSLDKKISQNIINNENCHVPVEVQECKKGVSYSEMATDEEEIVFLCTKNPLSQSVEYPDSVTKDELAIHKYSQSHKESKRRKVGLGNETAVSCATAGLEDNGTQRINEYKRSETNFQGISEVKGNDSNFASTREKTSPIVNISKKSPAYDKGIRGVPDIASSVKSWRKIFPWMYFLEKTNTFVCKYCCSVPDLGKDISHIIFSVKKPTDVYVVAKHLKSHNDCENHQKISDRFILLSEMFSSVYTLLKNLKYCSFQDIENQLLLYGNENFAKLRAHERKEYLGFWIKYLSAKIERILINSMKMSLSFSIVDLEDVNFSILRWIDYKGFTQEHLFPICGDLLLPYLQQKSVDVTRLISRSSFPLPNCLLNSVMYKQQIPIREPHMRILIQWLGETRLLNPLFLDLDRLVRLCKTYPHRFSQFPVLTEIIMCKEPYSHDCIVSKSIMECYIKNHAEFDLVVEQINEETGKSDAFNFCFCSNILSEAVQLLISDLIALWKYLTSKSREERDTSTLRKCRENLLFYSIQWNSTSIILEALNMVVVFVTHVITAVESPNRKSLNMFLRKLNEVTVADIEDCLIRLKVQYKGGSQQCLQDIQKCQRMIGLEEDYTVRGLVSVMQKRIDLLQNFNELYSFFHRLSAIPATLAHLPTNKFNLVACKQVFGDRIEEEYISSLAMIRLEGPPPPNTK